MADAASSGGSGGTPSFQSTSNTKESNTFNGGSIYFAPFNIGSDAVTSQNPASAQKYLYIGGAILAVLIGIAFLKK